MGNKRHPITNLDYAVDSIKHQIALLKEHQLEYYRIDITTFDDGSVNTYPDKFEEFLKTASASGKNSSNYKN